MRELSEVKYLLRCLNLIMNQGSWNYSPKDLRFGFTPEVFTLVNQIHGLYTKAEKESELAVAELGEDLNEKMVEADRAGAFLSRAGDHDGAQFCFALKNVYQWVLEEQDSKWDRFPTRRKYHEL